MGIILQTAACNQLSLKMLNAWNCFTTENSAGIGSPDLEDVVEIEGVEDPAVAPLVHEGNVQTEEIDPARNVLGSLEGQELGTVRSRYIHRRLSAYTTKQDWEVDYRLLYTSLCYGVIE